MTKLELARIFQTEIATNGEQSSLDILLLADKHGVSNPHEIVDALSYLQVSGQINSTAHHNPNTNGEPTTVHVYSVP